MPAAKPVIFRSVLTVATPESGWHYIAVEWKIGEKFPKNGGTRRVICTINGVETFPCALMPYDGEFTIVVNKERRKKLGIAAVLFFTIKGLLWLIVPFFIYKWGC